MTTPQHPAHELAQEIGDWTTTTLMALHEQGDVAVDLEEFIGRTMGYLDALAQVVASLAPRE